MPPPPKSVRKPGEIQRKFENQINAIRASAKAFDQGEHWEAERISTAVQTLFHTGGQSQSLLSQVGMADRSFLDSASPWVPKNKMANCGLVSFAKFKDRTSWVAELDDRPMRFVSFDEWWNGPVLTDGCDKGTIFSRKDLVRVMRNQDGGSHVDPLIDTAYVGMLESIGFIDEQGQAAAADGELFAMRQIGHEVLKSLVPAYRRRPPTEGLEVLWRGFVFTEITDDPEPDEGPSYNDAADRSECGCGSGRIFRICHKQGAQPPKVLERIASEVTAPPDAAFAQIRFGFQPG